MNKVQEVSDFLALRKGFFAGILGLLLFLLPYFSILSILPLFLYDFNRSPGWKRYLSLLSLISYALLLIPYLSILYIPVSSTWSLCFHTYLLSLSLYHLGEYLVQSYYHYEEANFSSN